MNGIFRPNNLLRSNTLVGALSLGLFGGTVGALMAPPGGRARGFFGGFAIGAGVGAGGGYLLDRSNMMLVPAGEVAGRTVGVAASATVPRAIAPASRFTPM